MSKSVTRTTPRFMPRRRALMPGAAALLAVRTAHVNDFPSRPLRLVVPFPAGGPTDALARMVAAELSNQLKQPVIVDNKSVAVGQIGHAQTSLAPTRRVAPAVLDSLRVPDLQARFGAQAAESRGLDSPAYAGFLRSEFERGGRIISDHRISIE